MKIVPFHRVPAAAWDEVVDLSREAWFFHRHEWVRVESEFWALSNHSFAVCGNGGQPLGVCPLYRRDIGRTRWVERLLDTGHHRHTGLALLDGLDGKERRAAWKCAMKHILAEAMHLDVDRILMNVNNRSPASLSGRRAELPVWALEYGFQMGVNYGPQCDVPCPGMSTVAADQLLELAPSEEALFNGIEEDTRNAVKKGIKSGLFFEDTAGDPIPGFYELAAVSAERTGEPLPSQSYYGRIWEHFGPHGRCAVLFALHEGKAVAATLLVCDKETAHYLAGVSHHEYLHMRVNNFLHWEAIKWAKRTGFSYYSLGPTFPTLPKDWPVAQVSHFKGTFGAHSYRVVEGSLFLKPERYLKDGEAELARLCTLKPAAQLKSIAMEPDWQGLNIILRTYGFLGLHLARQAFEIHPRRERRPHEAEATTIVPISSEYQLEDLGIKCRRESGRQLLYDASQRGLFRKPRAVYHALLPHFSFAGSDLEPIWAIPDGRPVMAWHREGRHRRLLIGLNIVEEVVRHTHGDPDQVEADSDKTSFGQPFERPFYLYEGQILDGYRTTPWADHLGFTLAELMSQVTRLPLIEPLPNGAHGLVILTGDDDQAALQTYETQLQFVGDLPITYFLPPQTHHTRETLDEMAPNVEFGLHVDALEEPDRYDEACRNQLRVVEKLVGCPLRAVRNHGILNRGYHGHLSVWEKCGLVLDFNLTGIDGTALTGTFLPFRMRRPDDTWSEHWSLLTTFTDGMIFARGLPPKEGSRRIRLLARQMEKSYAGVLVFNLHPENAEISSPLIREVATLSQRPGWKAIGVNAYLDWVETLNDIRLRRHSTQLRLEANRQVDGLVLRSFVENRWECRALPSWTEAIAISDDGKG